MYQDILNGDFRILSPEEVLYETKIFLENLELEGTVFRCNHPSNYVVLNGTLNEDKERLINTIDSALETKKFSVITSYSIHYTKLYEDWQEEMGVYLGATFNLGHQMSQMLLFRPHNKFEELENCYLVGGGTHPGSGLPTIYESGKISADLISKKFQRRK